MRERESARELIRRGFWLGVGMLLVFPALVFVLFVLFLAFASG